MNRVETLVRYSWVEIQTIFLNSTSENWEDWWNTDNCLLFTTVITSFQVFYFVWRVYTFFIFLCAVDVQFPRAAGPSSNQYTVAVRLTLDENLFSGSPLTQQSVRTCGASAVNSSSSELVSVKWNEIFFFKIESLVRNWSCLNIHIYIFVSYAMCLIFRMYKLERLNELSKELHSNIFGILSLCIFCTSIAFDRWAGHLWILL